MGKNKRDKRHFMDESFESYRKIRKPMPKSSRVIRTKVDDSLSVKFDWRNIKDDLGGLYLWNRSQCQ